MRLFFLLLFFLGLHFTCSAQNVYSLSINSIEGKKVDLLGFRGKKLLFITLPLSSSDTSVSLSELAALQTKYASSVVVIGVPMVEEGYKSSDAQKLKSMYKDLQSNFVLAEGMKVKKSSGAGQSSLFQWLTDIKQNKHFAVDIKGTGHKIFLDESGRQFAVMPPQVRLSSHVTDKILAYKMPQPPKTSIPATK